MRYTGLHLLLILCASELYINKIITRYTGTLDILFVIISFIFI